MRISELSRVSGIPVPTIKYYLREGLLPEGARTAATQADYGGHHVRRLRVIRALVDAGVGIAAAREVLRSIDEPAAHPHELIGAAHAAVTPRRDDVVDLEDAEELAVRLGWRRDACDPTVLGELARALRRLDDAGFDVPAEVMTAYVDAARRIAEAELAHVPTDSAEAAVRYVVLGSVLPESVLLALRRVAEQVVSAERFGASRPSPEG